MNQEQIWQTLYDIFVQNISKKTWFSTIWSEYLIWWVSIYFCLLILLLFIHSLIIKTLKSLKQSFFLECDLIIKQIATAQYKNKATENINIQLLNTIFESKSKDYFKESTNIISKINEIKEKTKEIIINDKQKSKLKNLDKRINWLEIISKTIWYTLNLLTIGIYKIFRK